MRFLGFVSLFALLAVQPGCISISRVTKAARLAMQQCAVETQPPGATIRLNGQRVGQAPCELNYPIGKMGRSDYHFSASLEGYRTEVKTLGAFPTYVLFELRPAVPAGPADVLECQLEELPTPTVRPSIAVLDFRVGEDVSHDVGEALADFCRETVQESQCYILVNRENMRAILSEEDFAATVQCDDTRCLVDFGKKLRAQKIIHGRAAHVGEALILTLKLVDVSSAAIEAICNVKTTGVLEELLDLTGPATCRLMADALRANGRPLQRGDARD